MTATYQHPFSAAPGSTCSIALKYVADNAAKLKGSTTPLKNVPKKEAWDFLKKQTASDELSIYQPLGTLTNAKGNKYYLRIISSDEVDLVSVKTGKAFFYKFDEFESKFIDQEAGSIVWHPTLPFIPVQAPLTEAAFEGMVQAGGWDVVQARIAAGTMPKGVDFLRITNSSGSIVKQAQWSGGNNFTVQFVKHSNPAIQGTKSVWTKSELDEVIQDALDKELGSSDLRWLGTKQPKAVIDNASTKTGALTDEDAATMFVKTKDELANQWGVSVKGANPKLDDAVYQAIAKKTGYTAQQLLAKVDRYKQSGKKLSSLKKKVLKDKPTLAEKSLPPPPSAAASQETIEKVVKDIVEHTDEVQMSLSYTDEEVAKAYVRAKDKVVGNSNGKWTLYSKSDELDNAVFAAIREQLPNLPNVNIKTQVARYIQDVKKLSQLKKELIKAGDLVPKAPTLKGPKTLAEKAVEKDGVKTAVVEKPKVEIFDFGSEETYVYNLTQTANIALSNTPEQIYEKLAKVSEQLFTQKHNFSKMGGYRQNDVLSIVRVLDAKKAAAFNKENAHLFENKLAEWVKSGEGKAHILRQKEMAKAAQDLAKKAAADLPADSANFKIISPDAAADSPYDARKLASADAREALRKYTGSEYHTINGALRNSANNATAQRMDKGMVTFKDDLLLHRGTNAKNLGVSSPDEIFSLIGKTVQDKGFTSTSVGGRPAFGGNVLMEIEAPKGVARGIYVDKISLNQGEKEMILARGTRFKVLSARREGGKVIVRVRVVP
jgi:hypothetical protein